MKAVQIKNLCNQHIDWSHLGTHRFTEIAGACAIYVGLQLRVRELWRELFTRACILI